MIGFVFTSLRVLFFDYLNLNWEFVGDQIDLACDAPVLAFNDLLT